MIIDKDEREKRLWLLYEPADPFWGTACLFTALKYSVSRALGKPLAYKERQTTNGRFETTSPPAGPPRNKPAARAAIGHKRQVPCAKRIATNARADYAREASIFCVPDRPFECITRRGCVIHLLRGHRSSCRTAVSERGPRTTAEQDIPIIKCVKRLD